MTEPPDRAAARIHWLVAGRFSAEPRGDSFTCAVKDLDAALAARVGSIRARIPDRLGPGDRRDVELPVRSLRSFTYAGVIEAVPWLRELRALAQRAPAAPDELVAEVERVAGRGKLLAACAAARDGAPAEARPPATGAAAAVDAFVKGTVPATPGASAARRLQGAVESAVFGTALDLLATEPLRGLEASWRGLRMLLAACPAGSDLHVELLDAGPEQVVPLVRARPPSDAFDEPDAVFVVEPIGKVDLLGELADLAEETLAPVVVGVAPEALGAADAAELAARAERGEPPPEAWASFRRLETARWLCAAVNEVVLFTEGGGAFQRTVTGSAAWPVAAMLSASYRAQGAFGGAVGKPGALPAPGAWMIPAGPQKGTLAPTRAFLAIPAQKALAGAGLVALGSVLNSDRLVLVDAPMASGAAGAAPLPAQLLTGRIVRFARWARQQLDPHLPPEQVSEVFQQAAALFLSPGMAGAVALGARVEGEGPERVLRVRARVNQSHALVPLTIEFGLPF